MKTANISYFKAHISQELREVRAGEHILILDRDIPVAEVIPFHQKEIIRVRSPKSKLSYPETSFSVETDPLLFLMEDRLKR